MPRAECGTREGWLLHFANGEPECEACQATVDYEPDCDEEAE